MMSWVLTLSKVSFLDRDVPVRMVLNRKFLVHSRDCSRIEIFQERRIAT